MPNIPSDDEIRLRAYYLWEINGRQDGRELDYWLQAALELEDLARDRGGEPAIPTRAAVAAGLDRPARTGAMRRTA